MEISNLPGKFTILFVICCYSLSAQGKYGSGTGEPNDPYQIWDANHMQAIGADANDWDKHFILMADIDLGEYTGTEFNIIEGFRGVFDGNGHTISNFTYTSPDRNGGFLFGGVHGPNTEIKNLGLINPNIDAGTGWYVGSLVGALKATITNCYVEGGTVSGSCGVGGLVVENWGEITNCYATGRVSGTCGDVSGLVATNYGTITNCYSTGSVDGNDSVGGLVGSNEGGIISNCYSTSDVNGVDNVGGLVGDNTDNSSVSNCFWDTDTQTHGVTESIGTNTGTVTNVAGLPTSQMQTKSTFTDADWDFINTWNIGENQTYPYLRKYSPANLNKDHKVDFLDIRILCEQWLVEE